MTINMDDINNNPITGEEIAGLIVVSQELNKQLAATLEKNIGNYFKDKAKQDGIVQAELINIQKNGFQEIKNMLLERDKEIDALKTRIKQNSRSTVTISYSASNASQWRKRISGTIEAIRLKLNLDRPEVYGMVYDRIKEKYGTDVRALFEANKNDYETIISMCSLNDGLRAKFDSSLNDIYDPVKYESADAMRMPENIRRDCLALAPDKDPRSTFRKILKKMKEITSIDLDVYIRKNSIGMRCTRFTKSYFVNKDDILFAVYKRAVAELMNSEV